MPPFLLSILVPLLRKRDTYYLAAIVILALFLWGSLSRVRSQAAALAARPTVESHLEVQTRTVTVAGKERVVEKIVAGAVVERIVYREPSTTTTGTERTYDRQVTPSCPPAPPAPWRYAGVLADPATQTKLVGLRGGVTLWNRLDFGVGARLAPRREWQIEAGIRF